MSLWISTYSESPSDKTLGPITTVIKLSLTDRLDKAGTFQLTVPLTDHKVLSQLVIEKRLQFWSDATGSPVQLGSGIIKDIAIEEKAGNRLLVITGPSLIDDLKRWNTLLGRSYSNQKLDDVLSDLLDLAGWSLETQGELLTNTISARFDGASVLQAIQEMMEHQGLHFRQGLSDTSLEVGRFGLLKVLNLVRPGGEIKAINGRGQVGLIDSITVVNTSDKIANWVLPVGQGDGEAALTLEKSTRSTPYIIYNTIGPDGSTLYFLQDTDSQETYGISQHVLKFREIGAISNTDADVELAANALYDAAAAYLRRNKDPLQTYRVTVRGAPNQVKPGDLVHIDYRGEAVDDDGRSVRYLDLDQDLWAMSVTKSYDNNQELITLELASVDRHPVTPESLIIGALEDIQLANTRIQTYPSVRSFVWQRDLDPTHTARLPIKLTDATTRLNRCLVNFVTRPFRANTTGASGGGGSVATTSSGGAYVSTVSSAGGGSSTPTSSQANNGAPTQTGGIAGGAPGGNHTHFGSIFDHDHTINIPSHTHNIDLNIPAHSHSVTIPSHSHDLVYGIYDDTARPSTLSLWINNVDRSAALGGPWALSGESVDIDIEISEYLVSASGGLRQKHTLEFKCSGGRGEVEVTVELYETIQAIALS